MPLRIASFLVFALIGALTPLSAQEAGVRETTFTVSFGRDWRREPVTGSVYLFVTRELLGEPRDRVGALVDPPWIYRIDVRDLEMGDAVTFDAATPGHPGSLADLPPGDYAWQAVIHADATDYEFARAPGNGKSRLKRGRLDPAAPRTIAIEVDTAIEKPVLDDRGRIRYRRIESRNVGRYTGERFFVDVAILLPENYGAALEEGLVFPVQYFIPTLGRRAPGAVGYFHGLGVMSPSPHAGEVLPPAVRVLIDPHGSWGHHLWADSSVNGPFLTAFFDELVPEIESRFAIHRDPASRTLIGHGAGGWAAVNLVTHRPDFFSRVYALAPDPLDFRSFYGVDLTEFAGTNALTEPSGRPRALATHEGEPVLTWGEQSEYERVLHRGGLFRSFETALAPAGAGGPPLAIRPPRLFDADTGAFTPEVVLAMLEQEPRRLIVEGSDARRRALDGKIHVLVGDRDDFDLAAPALGFAAALRDVGVAVDVEILDGVDHAGANAPAVHALVQRRILEAQRAGADRR